MAPRYDSLILRSRVSDATQAAQKDAFINALKRVGTVSVAAELIGINRKTVYRWRDEDETFKDNWDNALVLAFEGLESATYLKLANGLKNAQQRISMPEAKLIEMFLAGAKPEKYRQRGIEIDNSVNTANLTIDWSQVPDAIFDAYRTGKLTIEDVYQQTILLKEQQKTPSSDEGV